MAKNLNPSLVVLFALLISFTMTLITNGKVNWEKLAIDSLTYYFVYLRGKDDSDK
jgi:hypothetical protein